MATTTVKTTAMVPAPAVRVMVAAPSVGVVMAVVMMMLQGVGVVVGVAEHPPRGRVTTGSIQATTV